MKDRKCFKYSRFLILVFVVLLTPLLNLYAQIKSDSKLLVGIAEVNYTPEVGLDLRGNYRGNDYASRGVHDSLYARAIVAKATSGEKVAIVSVDIISMNKQTINFLRNCVASNTDIKPENVMITATHTHSGPPSKVDAPKAKEYLTKIANAVVVANSRLKPTVLSVGKSKEDRISHNRRLKCIDGTTHMCWEKFKSGFVVEPLGPIDPEVIAVSVKQNEEPAGVIVNFGCHATTLTGNNWLYSADYPGYMVESLRRINGKNYIPMFLNGPCGNVTQVDYRVGFIDTYQECQRIGYMLGIAAMQAIANEKAVTGNTVAVAKEMVPVKHISITDEQLDWAKQIMKKVEVEGMPPLQADGIPDAEYAEDWIQLSKTQNQIDSLEVMVVRIGDLAFVGLPGEMFCEFGMDIKSGSPFKNTLVMGLTNDARSYFPTQISFSQGPKGFTPMVTGYETTPGTTKYEPGSGEKLVQAAIKLLNKIQ